MGGAGGAGAMPPMPLGMNPQNNNMDPNQMMQLLDNPMVQQMMEQMVDQNPDAIRQMLEAQNPMLRQMFANNPEMGNQMVRQMMNPQALRSMLQLQQAMGGTGGMPGGMGMGGSMAPPSGGSAAGSGLDFSNLLGGGMPPTGQLPPAAGNPLDFSAMMQQLQGMQGMGSPVMGGTAPPAAPSNQHPADRYRRQLQSLRDMGFDDEQQCLAVLQQNHGNLNRAVDALLMGPPAVESSSPAPAPAPATPAPAPSASSNDTSTANNNNNNNDNEEQAPSEPKDATEKKND